MAVGGVDKIGQPAKRSRRNREEVYIFGDTVRVKRADPAADDVSVLADAATQPPAHETAVVFGVIPMLLGQLRIFLCGLRRPERCAISVNDVFPRMLLVLIFPVCLAVADGDFNRSRHPSIPPRICD